MIADDGQTLEFIIVATEPYLILGREALGIQFHMGSDDAQRLLLGEEPRAGNSAGANPPSVPSAK